MWKGLATFGATLLAIATAAAAAGPTIDVSVTPDTPSAHSKLKVSASGPFSESGLPKSLKLTAQRGFRASAKSVPVLCKSGKVKPNSANPCPAKSKIGSGRVVAATPFGKQDVPFRLYLGTPRHSGDIASIVLSGTLPIVDKTENVVGRLFKPTKGGLEILFNHLPSAPSGVTITVKRLAFSAYAVNGRHSLITNPRSCTRGHWKGSFTLTFSSGTISQPTKIPCSK